MAWLGERLKLARKAAGLSQKELAELVGVEPPTVSRWEKNVDEPSAKHVPAILKALKKDQSWFENDQAEISSRLLELERKISEAQAVRKTEEKPIDLKLQTDRERLITLFDKVDPGNRKTILAAFESLVRNQNKSRPGKGGS